MAVKLGKMLENKQNLENIKINERNRKLEQMKNLIRQCDPIVEMAKDIYDTYRYVRYELGETEFGKKLWSLLCRSETFDINSYFGFHLPIYNKKPTDVGISRFGVCIYRYEYKNVHTAYPKLDCNGNDENTWRGKYLLSDFIAKNDMTTKSIDDAIFTLEYFLDYFQNYADKFFSKVSEYEN